MMKKPVIYVSVIALFFLLLSSSTLAFTIPQPQGYVNDFGRILTPDWQAKLTELVKSVEQNTSTEITVVTINSLEGEDKAAYALAIGEQWGVGKKGKDNGIVILIAVQEREYRIEVGKGLEGALNDAKVGRIARTYLIPSFKRQEYGQGLYDTLEALRKVISQEPDLAMTQDIAQKENDGIIHLFLLGWLLLVLIISASGKASLKTKYAKHITGSSLGIIAGFFFGALIGIDIFFYALMFFTAFAIITSPRVPGNERHGGWFGGGNIGGFGGGSSGGFGGGGFGGGGAGGGW